MHEYFIVLLFIFTGMAKRCHRTLQSVITKVMQTQEDWPMLLNSVLFTMHYHTHSSTGYSPIRMLYQKDPIMPFELAHKKVDGSGNDIENETDMECEDQDDNQNDPVSEGSCKSEVDEVFQMVEAIEHSEKMYLLMLASEYLKLKNIKPNVIIEGMLLVQVLRSACLY